MRIDMTTPAALVVAMLAAGSAAGQLVRADFDGDRFDDLAIGVPGERVNGKEGAGAVQVLHGSSGRLSVAGAQLWHQDAPGVRNAARRNEFFGGAVASGDFDGDGFADLAIGVSGQRVGGSARAGAVHILYGGPSGLSGDGDQLWHQNTDGIAETAEKDDQFGDVLVTGDFDGDRFDDLAVGVPREGRGDREEVGVVHVLYGGPEGLSPAGDQLWHQNRPGVPGVARKRDRFGSSLAATDLDGDGRDDLAIGVPDKNIGGEDGAGAVVVLYGSGDGLEADDAQRWSLDAEGLAGEPNAVDGFGRAVAGGDFDGDRFADLAIGVPGEDIGNEFGAGTVRVLYGGPAGVSGQGSERWHQNRNGVPGDPEPLDFLGWTLVTSDFNGDGLDDLAAGAIFEDVGSAQSAGAVNVFYGAPGGLTAEGSQYWHQERSGLPTAAEEFDQFGSVLGAGDFDGDGFFDLVIGVPAEGLAGKEGAGAVHVLYGRPSGLKATGAQFWHQGKSGIATGPRTGDNFGAAVSGE